MGWYVSWRLQVAGSLSLLACAATAPGAGNEAGSDARGGSTAAVLRPGDHSFTIRHDGRSRTYLVHVPPGYRGDPAPVVLALHGGGGHAAQFKEENGLDAVADRHGFIAVYPDGTGPIRGRLLTWNSAKACCGWALEHRIDDVGFLAAVIANLARRTTIDERRVYVTGHSNGSMMAYRLAAERADLVAAVVGVGGAMDLATFAPSRPVPVLHIHSVDDPRALYEGGLGPPFPGTSTQVPHAPVMAGLDLWANRDGCRAGLVERSRVTGSGANAGQSVTRLAFEGCQAGTAVEHLRLTGAGHGWPGVEVGRVWQKLIGPATTLIDASEEAWAFASRFSR
ncbi:MAG: PHB depolymerase family esterase [Gemmatimonadales bacterium]